MSKNSINININCKSLLNKSSTYSVLSLTKFYIFTKTN